MTDLQTFKSCVIINHSTCIELGFLFKLNLLWLLVLRPYARHHSDPVRFQMLYQTLPPSKRSETYI